MQQLAAEHLVVVLPDDVEPDAGPAHLQPSVHVSEAVQAGAGGRLEAAL